MKPKLNKNLSLPWTPQGEKASGNHQIILPRENATCTSLISPICLISWHDPTFWLSCINNSLTSPTVLLWPVHHQSHNFYQLSSSCEQKLIIRKHHILYERKTVNTWNHNGRHDQSTNSYPGSPFFGQKPLRQKQYLVGEVGENCLIQV